MSNLEKYLLTASMYTRSNIPCLESPPGGRVVHYTNRIHTLTGRIANIHSRTSFKYFSHAFIHLEFLIKYITFQQYTMCSFQFIIQYCTSRNAYAIHANLPIMKFNPAQYILCYMILHRSQLFSIAINIVICKSAVRLSIR